MARDEEIVRSRANPLFRRLRALKERARAGEDELCLLEGPRLVEEALAAGATIAEVAVSPRAEGRSQGDAVLATLRARGVPVRRLREDLLASLSETETSQGLLALARRPVWNESQLFEGCPLVVVAVGLQNPGNLGGLLRTAEAAGATGVYLTEGSADPYSWKALRGAMGSAFRLPLVRRLEVGAVLDALESRGIPLLATAADGEIGYGEVDLSGPVALAFGSEAGGLPHAVVRRAKARVRIPLTSPVESLNVGVAAGVVLFEAARQRGYRSRSGER